MNTVTYDKRIGGHRLGRVGGIRGLVAGKQGREPGKWACTPASGKLVPAARRRGGDGGGDGCGWLLRRSAPCRRGRGRRRWRRGRRSRGRVRGGPGPRIAGRGGRRRGGSGGERIWDVISAVLLAQGGRFKPRRFQKLCL